MKRDDLVSYLNERLCIDAFEDASINGLQVQGKAEVEKIALVADAAMALYERAAVLQCDMMVAHHGMIWRGLSSITGRTYAQVKLLLDCGINLYAAHLPLDAHPELGNNVKLAEAANLIALEPFGKVHGRMLGVAGRLQEPLQSNALADVFCRKIGGTPLILPFGKQRIETVGIVSGGGSSALAEAVDRKLDCFVTGEGRHENHHLALESKINVIYLGHYHSEILGVKAVGKELESKFGLTCVFIDEPTAL